MKFKKLLLCVSLMTASNSLSLWAMDPEDATAVVPMLLIESREAVEARREAQRLALVTAAAEASDLSSTTAASSAPASPWLDVVKNAAHLSPKKVEPKQPSFQSTARRAAYGSSMPRESYSESEEDRTDESDGRASDGGADE